MGTSINPFSAPGNWYRGNLHTHTTKSDGHVNPVQAAAWYREHGYHFLAITDHDHCTDVSGLSSPGYLVLPGIEVHPDRSEVGERYHLVGVGASRSHSFQSQHKVQDAVDELRADGAQVILAHPYWSGLTLADTNRVQGVIGMEVFNTGSELTNRGTSTVHWDDLLVRGRLLWGVASDDAHWEYDDYGHGWIMLKAPELTQPAILTALSAGSFYATCGPEVYDFQVTGKEVYVRCSPVKIIACISVPGFDMFLQAPGPDRLVTEFSFPIRRQRIYVRIACVDAQGQTAWLPPVML